METLKVIYHTNGDDKCLEHVVNYPIGKDQVLKEGFGINPNDSWEAMQQFKKVTEFWGNQDKTPCFHYMASFSKETATTPEKAMELTKEIFENITPSHLTAMGAHNKEREGGVIHTHTAVNPTDNNDGSMLYGDYRTNYALAQKMADVTGQPTKLVVRKENGEEKECPMIFVPRDDEE
ncbi:relaxase/mobilization nuclease domain-containing protein [uncultured Ruminococcus sp.]|uniref:relaxase/mobilization nuclease domain-containing protein n=1 Tax=uncultured Ruminococcus sp. TaxID=165186 RepID=UPI0025FB3F26|nr:relaxase/mobilization nuclease domain-containing protein [uncultured Ruminococcus sp.]